MKVNHCIITKHGISCLEKININNNLSKYIFGYIYIRILESFLKFLDINKNNVVKDINNITFFE